jgi:hypothetical protein
MKPMQTLKGTDMSFRKSWLPATRYLSQARNHISKALM